MLGSTAPAAKENLPLDWRIKAAYGRARKSLTKRTRSGIKVLMRLDLSMYRQTQHPVTGLSRVGIAHASNKSLLALMS